MPDSQDRRRRNPRLSDEYAQHALKLRQQVDTTQRRFRNLMADGVFGPDEAVRQIDALIAMRRELWENMELYFGALRQELEEMIDGERQVAVPSPLSEAEARLARH